MGIDNESATTEMNMGISVIPVVIKSCRRITLTAREAPHIKIVKRSVFSLSSSSLIFFLIPVVCGRGRKCGRMREKEAGKPMTERLEVAPAPAPLEEYVKHFDGLFGKSNQREGFRRYVEGLLLPSERHKTLTGLTNTEPVVGAQVARPQRLQWFLSESDWSERAVQAERLRLLREDVTTAPTAQGVLVIDETGDRKDGHQTAHVSRQYLANLGQIDNGVVSVSSLWADEGVYYPVDVEPYTPAVYEASGKQ